MINNKRKYLIFILILIAFVSIGGVSANTQDNTTSITNTDVLDETVLIDDSLYDEQPTILTTQTSDFNNTVEVDDNPQLSSQDSSNSLLLDNDSDYVVNSPIVNPDFEDGLNGWDGYGVSITNFALNSKSGTKFISLSTNGYISQFINFDTIDSVSFWYMSNTKNATIDIHVDDISLDNYTIKKTGLGKKKWEEVKLDLSNFTGYHTLNISQIYGSGYLDYFNITYNNNLVANFTIGYYEIFDGKISINFTDLSQGLINEYLWDFGDGKYSDNQNPTHIFKLDNLNITLTVLNSYSTSSYNLLLPITLPTIERTGGSFSTIQEAIDNAVDGDVIIIASNVLTSDYFENLIVNKSITLNFINSTFNPKNINVPLISVLDGVNVSVINISLGKMDNIFKTGNISTLTVKNSYINDTTVVLYDGNIQLGDNQFSNSYLTIINSNTIISNCNINNGGIIVNGGKSKILNNTISSCEIAMEHNDGHSELVNNIIFSCGVGIQQNGGYTNITSNLICLNDVGVNVFGGNSDIHFNCIYSNNNYSLVYKTEIDYSNNWWGSNNPTFSYGNVSNGYFDVYRAGNIESAMDLWLVLNVTQHDLDVDKWIGGVTYYNLTIDLTHNNLGENTSRLGHLWNRNYTFNFNDVDFDIFLEDGFKQLLFTWGYLTGDVSQMNIKFDNENYRLFIDADNVAPVITYITPTTSFDDEMEVVIECDDSEAVIFYTLDSSNPCYSNTRAIYSEPFVVNESTSVHITAIDKMGNYARYNYTCTEVVGILDGRYNLNRYQTKYYDFVYTYFKNSDFIKDNVVWGKYQYNNGVSNYNGSLTNLSRWSNNIISSGSVVIDKNGHIYVGSDDGYLYCLNNQGLVIWRYGTTSKIICTPAIGYDGNIYFSNWMNSTVYCISPEGQLIWKYILGDYNTGSSPVFGFDGTLYVLTTGNFSSNLFAFKNNELLWNCTLPIIDGSTPAIAYDGSIYLVDRNHELVVVNWDGTLKYSFSLIRTDLILVDSILFETHVSVTVEDNVIYVINQPHFYDENAKNLPYTSSFIRAYNLDGSLRWFSNGVGVNDKYIFSGMPTYYNGILFMTGNNNLVAVNSTDGSVLWRSNIIESSYSVSSPLISNNEIIYVTQSNMVYAFNLDGEQLWNYTLTGKYGNPSSLSSPTLSNDGTLIVTTNQGIYAFNDVAAQFKWEHVNNTETTIQFTDLSVKGNNSYFWDFGDGNYSLEQNPIHTYNDSGKYRVVLIVEHDGMNLARNTTITVIKQDITPPSNVVAYINNTEVESGVYSSTQFVSLNASDDTGNVTIYYTVDGSNPVNSSTKRVYYEEFAVESDCILSMVAVDESGNVGNVTSIRFVISDSINVNDKINSTLIQKIQELLDNAEEGSKFVFDYDELYGANFTVNKPLNIITTNNTKLVGNGVQPVLTFTDLANGSSLNGFVIENTNAEGILIKDTSNITIRNTIVEAVNSTGINVLNSASIFIQDTKVNSSNEGILVDNSMNTTLNRVDVENCYSDGIWVFKSENTVISNSLIENNGLDPYKMATATFITDKYGKTTFTNTVVSKDSRANNILIDNSKNTSVCNNVINYGYFGLRLYHNTDGVVIDNNTFYEGVGDAILLSNRYSNVNITHNLIDGCYNGVNFMGYSQNVSIIENTIENLHEHDGDLQSFKSEITIYNLADYVYEYHFPPDQFFNHCYNGIQISHGASNVHEGNTIIIDNVIIKLQHRAWEARKYQGHLDTSCDGYGYNLYDGSDSYHGKTSGATSYREGKVDLVVDRVGDSSFRLRLINRLDGHYLSNIPEFDVTFIAGGFSQTVKFKGSEAVATFDTASAITTVVAKVSVEVQKYISWNIPITEGYNSTNKKTDSGYEAGEAINNPDPVIPSIADAIKELERRNSQGNGNGQGTGTGNGDGNGNGNGQGTGTGNGQGSGNGHGSSGHGGSNINGREGEIEGNANNLIQTNGGTSPSVGVETAAEGDSDTVEGGSESGGGSEEPVNAYEVSKVININENNWQSVQAVILFSIFIILGYGYRRGKKDGDEI